MKINSTNFQHRIKLLCLALSVCSLLSCSDKKIDLHKHKELTTGKQLYNYHCAPCHRESGRGQVMRGIPPVTYSELNHSKMRKVITEGHNSKSQMPVFKEMPKDEARKITRYVNELSQ